MIGANNSKFLVQLNWDPVKGSCAQEANTNVIPPPPSPPLPPCDSFLIPSPPSVPLSSRVATTYSEVGTFVTLFKSSEFEGTRAKFDLISTGGCHETLLSPINSLKIEWNVDGGRLSYVVKQLCFPSTLILNVTK